MDDLDSAVAKVMSTSASPSAAAPAAAGSGSNGAATGSGSKRGAYVDGPGRYELVSFVSHMGSNLGCGHYVCHIKKDGRWVINSLCLRLRNHQLVANWWLLPIFIICNVFCVFFETPEREQETREKKREGQN